MVLINILVFIFVLGLVILIHEFGHFIMAKRANILCHEFSIGMGPVLWKTKKGETVYAIRAIPIGGYVMMAGEEVESDIVKVGDSVRLQFDDFKKVEKIILNTEDEEYQDLPLVDVYDVDLQGKNNEPLHINEFTVNRDAMFVDKTRELQIAPYERTFQSKTKTQRFLSIFAGPFMNFVLAFLVFILLNFLIGFPNMDDTIIGPVGDGTPASAVLEDGDKILSIEGNDVYSWDDVSNVLDENRTDRNIVVTIERDDQEMSVSMTPVIFFYSIGFRSADGAVNTLEIAEVTEDTLAEKAGFEGGDVIVTVDGQGVTTWMDLATAVSDNTTGEEMEFTVLRDSNMLTLTVSPYNEDLITSQGLQVVDSYIGISPVYEFKFFQTFSQSAVDVKESAGIIFTTIRLLFDNDQVGVGDLAGPVGIYEITSRALSQGFYSFLSWTALLSVNLGVINLLPIPALDGGRLVFLGYEAVTNKKPNQKVENMLHYIMFILLMGLFVFITFNDILRLFNIR